MFAEKPYDDVFVEDIAARAGVSRALMYHYFPSKRDLYVAIFKRAGHRFLARADPDLQLALTDQLANGLEAHIQYFADHPFEAIAINRGALSDDPAIQAIVTNELNIIGRRLIDGLVTEGRLREVTEIAVEGWLAFVRAACVKWVQSRKITRADLTDMCLRAFDCALGHPGTPQARPKELIGKHLAVEPSAVSPHPPQQSPPGPSIAAPTPGLSCGRPPPTSSPKSNVAARPSARSKRRRATSP